MEQVYHQFANSFLFPLRSHSPVLFVKNGKWILYLANSRKLIFINTPSCLTPLFIFQAPIVPGWEPGF